MILKGVANIQTGKLDFAVQIEKNKSGDMYTGEYFGFTSLDEVALSLFLTFVSEKLQEIAKAYRARSNFKMLAETHTVFAEMLSKRTTADFILCLRKSLAKVIGYEHCGLLYFTPKSTLS